MFDRTRRLRLAATALALAFASAPAAAQETRGAGRAEWGGFPGGAVVFTRSTETDVPEFTNYTLGTSFAWNINRWVGLETEAGFGIGGDRTITVDGRRIIGQPMPDTAAYSGNVVLNPIGGARFVVPYVTAGLGAFVILPRDGTAAIGVTERQTLFTTNIGGGVKWYSATAWGVRGDYRLMMLDHHDEAPQLLGGQGLRYAHRVYAGVFATF